MQSLALLRDDVRWWFSASDHGVKIVLLIKFSQGQDQLVLEKWEEEELPEPPGPLTRSRARQCGIRLVRRQEITISRNGTDPASYNVAGGALVLGFKLLFLRDPEPKPGGGGPCHWRSSLATVCEARLGGSCAGLGVSEAGLGMSKLAAAAISGVSLDSQAAAISPENRFGHASVCLLAF